MEKENKIIVAYHGTSKENHDKILKSGYFKKGTWFAFDKKDAIHYGGLFVFKCYFNKDEFLNGNKDDWQFFLNKNINLFDLNTELDKEKLLKIQKDLRDLIDESGDIKDIYTRGMYNGVEYIISTCECREPKYK